MTARDFAFWLQGFLELRGPGPMTAEQVDAVSKHLALVFIHEIDPSMPQPAPKTAHETKLDESHAQTTPPWAGSSHGDLVMRC